MDGRRVIVRRRRPTAAASGEGRNQPGGPSADGG
jgi:hypothetical protein